MARTGFLLLALALGSFAGASCADWRQHADPPGVTAVDAGGRDGSGVRRVADAAAAGDTFGSAVTDGVAAGAKPDEGGSAGASDGRDGTGAADGSRAPDASRVTDGGLDTIAPSDGRAATPDVVIVPPPDAPASPDLPTDVPVPQPDAPLLALGQTCPASTACASGHCIDGVCCDSSCSASCMTCVKSGSLGSCSPVPAGQPAPPGHPPCQPDPPSTCRQTGLCDGAGKCQVHASGVVCRDETCSAGTYAPPSRCNGEGTCVAAPQVPCGSYPCEGTKCKTSCASSAECAAGYCASGACVPKKADGSACTGGGECVSGSCTEGVCCDLACGSKCYSCLAANTGLAQGKCAPVAAGKDPRDDCLPADPKTCGNDGQCDGRGACRKHAPTTMCQPESCTNDGASSASSRAAAFCDGNGTCAIGTPQSCGAYLCASDGVRCATRCQSSTDCASSAYCSTDTCRAKKPLGAVCASYSECASSICGGRCCSTSCTCPQPSSQNLLKNAGFDSDLQGWGGLQLEWNSMDADACPYSGSAFAPAATGAPYQCVTVSPGASYTFSGWFKNQPGASYRCYAHGWTGAGCTETFMGAGEGLSGNETSWTYKWMAVQVPSAVVSISVQCDNTGTYVDKLYLGP